MGLITKERCNEIVAANVGFISKTDIIDGTEIVQYSYKFATPETFAEYDAYELRGICFIKRPDGTWERNLMLHKFFNLHEVPERACKKIKCVQDKEDGSLIRFIQLNNGRVIAKTKYSFDNEQCIMANKLYQYNKEAIDKALYNRVVILYELVSPYNQIVLDNYYDTELICIQYRDELSGSYISPRPTKYHNVTLESVQTYAKEATGVEGWVVTFEDGYMCKVKTDWYFQKHKFLHGLLMNDIIRLCVDKKLDDEPKYKDMVYTVYKWINDKSLYVKNILEENNSLSRKEIAIKFIQDPMFPAIINHDEGLVVNILLKLTNKHEKAKEWFDANYVPK